MLLPVKQPSYCNGRECTHTASEHGINYRFGNKFTISNVGYVMMSTAVECKEAEEKNEASHGYLLK